MKPSEQPMRRTFWPTIPVALVSATLLVACAGSAGASPSEPPVSGVPASADDLPGSAPPVGDVPTAMLERVITDAASGAGVDQSDVEVVAAEAVTWPDGALGCPQPDQMYTQALVPGYQVILEIDGEELHFHASESGEFVFCADPQPPADDGAADR